MHESYQKLVLFESYDCRFDFKECFIDAEVCNWLFTSFIFLSQILCFENWCCQFFYYIINKMVFLKMKKPVTLPLWIAMLIRKLRVRRKLLKQAKHALYSIAQWVEISLYVASSFSRFFEFLYTHNKNIL